jgi:hypothetical protein
MDGDVVKFRATEAELDRLRTRSPLRLGVAATATRPRRLGRAAGLPLPDLIDEQRPPRAVGLVDERQWSEHHHASASRRIATLLSFASLPIDLALSGR